jgi:TetR/AcrR family transcriptional regulator, lmrAB and yxaGH operons repressor
MAHSSLSESDLLERALELFRTYGYEGVSLSRLSEATGLEKASLYYRYPGGKEQIASAVLARVIVWFQEHVFAPLKAEGSPLKRIQVITEELRSFYANGSKPCVIEALSIASSTRQMEATLKLATEAWLKAFAEIARETGLPPTLARRRAEEAIAGIEGSLVLARVLNDNAPFQRALKALPQLLTSA